MSQTIKGETHRLSPAQTKMVSRLYERRIPADQIITLEFARELYNAATELNQIIGVLIARSGHIEEVVLGTSNLLYIKDPGRARLGQGRLRGQRLIFSDLSSETNLIRIPSDIYGDLEKLRLDLVAGVKTVGNQTMLSYAYNLPVRKVQDAAVRTEFVKDLGNWQFDFATFIRELEGEHGTSARLPGKSGQLRAVLVGVYSRASESEASMAELSELARTAGIEVVDRVVQKRTPDPKTILGKGKLEEVFLLCLRMGVELVVFDSEIKPSQWRAIVNLTSLRIIDRSMLILDIFARRATSADGRLQVELAQLKYNLPRLVELDNGLSRLTGGIGGRGPGETKLEIGRRRSRERIQLLEKQLKEVGKRRQLRRGRRRDKQVPLVAILGYTNVGKSTLFNYMTGADVIAENKLFATLDPAQRQLFVPEFNGGVKTGGGRTVVVSDTVGFIQDLPKELANAFKATLEELMDAVVLVHVADAADPLVHTRIQTVDSLLEEMGLATVPTIRVLNKVDIAAEAEGLCRELEALPVSAITGEGVDTLLERISQELRLYSAPIGD